MLKLLRKKKVAKRIFYVLAAIIIPAFVIWGSASVIHKGRIPSCAGIIFGKAVSFDDFQSSLEAWKTQMRMQYGEKAEDIIKAFFHPVEAAWDRLILLQEVRRRKIRVSDAELIAMVTNLPFLQKDGRFDPQAYDLFLKYSLNEPPRLFEEHMRQNLSLAKLFQEMTKDIKATDEEIRKAYADQNETVRVQYVAFPFGANTDKIATTDEELKSYYEQHREQFKVPPQLNASYLYMEFKDTATEEEKEAAQDKLTKAVSLAKTKGIAYAAQTLQIPAKETGLFGLQDPVPGLGWAPEASQALFDLSANGISRIIATSHGLYLFQIKEKKDAYIPEFKDIKDKIKTVVVKEKAKEAAHQGALDFLNKAKEGSGWEKALQESHLAAKDTPFFARPSYIPEIGTAEPLKTAVFKLKAGEVAPEVIELEQAYYVVKLLEMQKVDEEKFKKDKEEFAQQTLDQKRDKAFNDFFQDLKKRARLVSYISPDLKIR